MSVTEPKIDVLLDDCDNNGFLLSTLTARRAVDINNMLRAQHNRITQIQEVDDITPMVGGTKPLNIAIQELAEGRLSYDHKAFNTMLSEENR